ncbi:heavy metal translocating P-type ATPase [Staphylococcus pseudintermedius]|uniref:heavy metal translocating P-type ATPase n=1 Tax=Staphylococcus pseudintermedius TaxID=283734 RepID=UPI0008061E98|nr:heavy metal translocating P-type ATPase [Staphylococcus pseudintermedius]ANQ81278.1 copper-translocating P-type ATPase [Staphylococcus pseudintermedius]EGQ3531695.1 copper-translocating P-type ATPase [Staphylococcus pseudintermedius]EGQ3546050.1 copper-translocating P-type ATPase [Staphylococcus pseudintermedius]EGQ3654389.1 copper-translocating P-type ATPase [Staphylococcus pseudintermedius]EGQ3671452.1 copper-translocating P-type ATPase [Staphylococcus pseudintermedius]
MTQEETFKITGMTCAACSARIERVLQREAGIDQINVNLVMENGTVKYDPSQISIEEIYERVAKIGYEAFPMETKDETAKRKSDELKRQKGKFIISLILALPLLYTMFGHFSFLGFIPVPELLMNGWFQFILATPIQFVLGWQFYVGAYKSLKSKSANMDVLVAMGTSAAYFYSLYLMLTHLGHSGHVPLYFETSAVLITLILLGKYFEMRAKGHASDAISKLAALQVKDAEVERDGKIEMIAIDDVRVGDIVWVRSGQQIPLDGQVIEGSTTVNEAMLTGESMPVEKNIGDTVIGSTINQTNFIKLQVTHVGEDLVLNQIIKVVEEAQNDKPQIQRLADKISNIFVPTVVVLALLSFIVWFFVVTPFQFTAAFEIFIAVIVIACPCALGLATPTSIMVGSGRAAESGILFKTAEALEQAQHVDTIVFDKTGTITNGEPKVVHVYHETEEVTIGTYVKSLEMQSEHPLSKALVDYYSDEAVHTVSQYETHAGSGISGVIDDNRVRIGSIRFVTNNDLTQEQQDRIHSLAEQGATVVGMTINETLVAIIGVRDDPKAEAKAVIETLNKNYDLVMLSGDSKQTAQAIGRELGFTRVIAEVKPDEKSKVVTELQNEGKRVMMVGDGINDAPALMKSDIGVAMGSGSDIALESADIALVRNHLDGIAEALQLSRLTIKNIKQNLFFAFCYNLIGIPIAAAGFLAPWVAGTAMAFSSVSVVLNALRLKNVKK